MQCLLIRHGIAVPREDWGGAEPQRPLSDKGRTRTRHAAEGLARLTLKPDLILTSPLIRAHQTAEIVQRALGKKPPVRMCEELMPGHPPEQIAELLGTFPQDHTLVCVGHEPGLGELAGLLLFGKASGGLRIRKAGACLIHCPDGAKPGRGYLEWWMPPSQLRAIRHG